MGVDNLILTRAEKAQELLDQLSALLAQKGWLSGLVIDEIEDMPSSSTFRHRFGSLVRAYHLVGFSPSRDYLYIETTGRSAQSILMSSRA